MGRRGKPQIGGGAGTGNRRDCKVGSSTTTTAGELWLQHRGGRKSAKRIGPAQHRIQMRQRRRGVRRGGLRAAGVAGLQRRSPIAPPIAASQTGHRRCTLKRTASRRQEGTAKWRPWDAETNRKARRREKKGEKSSPWLTNFAAGLRIRETSRGADEHTVQPRCALDAWDRVWRPKP